MIKITISEGDNILQSYIEKGTFGIEEHLRVIAETWAQGKNPNTKLIEAANTIIVAEKLYSSHEHFRSLKNYEISDVLRAEARRLVKSTGVFFPQHRGHSWK